jgi:hypothetical protein
MDYPIEMLVINHDADFVRDVLTVLAAGDRDRAAGHGLEDFRQSKKGESAGDAEPQAVQTEIPAPPLDSQAAGSSLCEVAPGEQKLP